MPSKNIKAAPAFSHKETLKKLEDQKDFAPEELRKLRHFKVKIEATCEAGDVKKINDLWKKLAKQR